MNWLDGQDNRTQQWVKASGFIGDPDTLCCIPESTGILKKVLLGVSGYKCSWHFGGLPKLLPPGRFWLNRTDFENSEHYERALLAFGLGSYQFNAYQERLSYPAKLFLPKKYQSHVIDWLTTIYLVRDLINTPAEDMGPLELAMATKYVAEEFDAEIKFIEGKKLEVEFPAIYAVGRASNRLPLLIDLKWGNIKAPKVILVGKGVCFDSGGLNIKTSSDMLLMKKDMGGAAHALGLARMIMLRQLPIRLRLLIPAVENVVGSQSYRPGDILQTRAKKTVEIINTDAEGRLVLADALAEAVTDSPDLLIDFSTLTGAARVALGPQLPALFCNRDFLAKALLDASIKTDDPMWRLPLYQPYRIYLKTKVADLANSSKNHVAGAIIAALFLQYFVSDRIPWAHFDIFAWNTDDFPGRPIGGEAMTLRAILHYLEKKYQ